MIGFADNMMTGEVG